MTQPLNYGTAGVRPPRRGLIMWLFMIALAIVLFLALKQKSPGTVAVPLSTFYSQVRVANISRLSIDGDEISGQFRTPITVGASTVGSFHTYLPEDVGRNWMFTQWLLDNSPNTVIVAEPTNSLLTNFILPFIPWLLILAFIWFFVFRQLRKNSVQPKQPMPVIIVNPERA